MLNNPQTHGVLVFNATFKVTIISLLKCIMDLSSRKKYLTCLFGSNYSSTTLVRVSTDFIKDALALSRNNIEINCLNLMLNFSAYTKKKKFNIPDQMSICSAPIISTSFGDYKVSSKYFAIY